MQLPEDVDEQRERGDSPEKAGEELAGAGCEAPEAVRGKAAPLDHREGEGDEKRSQEEIAVAEADHCRRDEMRRAGRVHDGMEGEKAEESGEGLLQRHKEEDAP